METEFAHPTDLPKGASNAEAPDVTEATNVFKNVVEQSKKNIDKTFIDNLPSEKRRRGRPKLPRDNKGNILRSESEGSAGASPSMAPQPPPDVSEYFVMPIQALSKIPANRTKIPELAFDDKEAEACAKSLNQVLNVFFPDLEKIDPKAAAIFSAATTFGSIIFTKYTIYAQVYTERWYQENPVENPEENPADQPEQTIEGPLSAENVFRRVPFTQ